MKTLLKLIIIPITATLALFGLTSKDVKPVVKPEISITKISETTPLYLTPAKDLYSDADTMITRHYSHYSHYSHRSHHSHSSHWSHYSSY